MFTSVFSFVLTLGKCLQDSERSTQNQEHLGAIWIKCYIVKFAIPNKTRTTK